MSQIDDPEAFAKLSRIAYEFDEGEKIVFIHEKAESWHLNLEYINADGKVVRFGMGECAGDIFLNAVLGIYRRELEQLKGTE